EDKVSEEEKIITLLTDQLRKNNIEADEATLCLPGKDLIIRSFEMPTMPRNEIAGAVNFEVRKYIPFKVENLNSAFQVYSDKASRTNLILFVGIKEKTLNSYTKILQKLNIRINSIEYSAFSVLRILKLNRLKIKGVASVLSVDLKSEDEINFLVLDKNFPVFSRDIVLGAATENLRGIQEDFQSSALDKLKAEIRVSLDYYRRKFPEKYTDKILIIANQNDHASLKSITSDIGVQAEFVDLTKYVDSSVTGYLSFLKGYTSSLSNTVKTKVSVDLLVTAEKKEAQGEITQKEILALAKGLRPDRRVFVLCLFLIIATYVFGIYRVLPFKRELTKMVNANNQLAGDKSGASYEEMTALDENYKKKLDALDNLIKNQLYLTEIINLMPKVMPEGTWLTSINYRRNRDDRVELILDGMTYLGQSDKEFSTVSEFVSLLQVNPEFAKNFTRTAISSLASQEYRGKTVTSFKISSKNY
ncbi:MAG: pilus assembly protein PilM, partial [Candidatus Omnitrophica bacterium]|nr:pilus assembly protein PilM [Candidatus Omnitrophota bacterium]